MKKIVLVLSLLVSIASIAQNNAFQAGEKLVFTAAYNMSGVLTELAEVRMETSEVKTSKATLMRLKCTATTYSKWDNFFKIRDIYESYVNPKTLTPYLYQRDIDEGGHDKFVKYTFNHKTNTVKSLIRKKSKNFPSGFWDRNNNVSINPGTKDLVTTLYYIRTLDIHKAAIGSTDTFTVLFDNKETKVSFKLLAKESIQTNIGKKECYKLAINVIGSDVLKGNNDNLIWLTADENKIPVYAKFKIPVGNGELRIKSVTGLKN
ncbi:DUF3108 domain-containing protein [Oceanihabitans sediminis]|uniref:DUF3108 domain-containing protein n=1 Tax=Oceanihabitans sediminis TaxID=1812012 RepID=A0A368P5D8_9FLAO|nr:DUF3108 domain-containing protein [Oceanihabitans sediminis]MDX1278318.1 DUF3108 domain-containing protein [Oceanihabitans sediminis]RBP32755.1 uncharacterized protein DUF3108 [Oceanihabitans sediminis]RCU57708.1 DUF3108 domain-containing protein [Oceanihabitans sediminis]